MNIHRAACWAVRGFDMWSRVPREVIAGACGAEKRQYGAHGIAAPSKFNGPGPRSHAAVWPVVAALLMCATIGAAGRLQGPHAVVSTAKLRHAEPPRRLYRGHARWRCAAAKLAMNAGPAPPAILRLFGESNTCAASLT